MKRHMARIFKRVEDGVYVKSDSEQLCLEIKDLTARISGLDEQVAYYRGVCEEQAMAIGVLDRGADEQAATARTRDRRIEKLERQLRHADATLARRTQAVVDATLRKAAR